MVPTRRSGALGFAALVVAAVVVAWGAGSAWHARRGPRPAELLGLWMESDPRQISDEMRFYYFHQGGKGLYRYGQVGHNQTHSFDWRVDDGGRLELAFRKRGERGVTRVVLGDEGGRRTLTLLDDPRGPSGPGRVRYRATPTSLTSGADELVALAGPLALVERPAIHDDAEAVAGRMWIDLRRWATGGVGFVLYQLSDVTPRGWQAGWKLGWHHVGDFDDWTTETLAYRAEPGALRLRFLLRGDEAVTPAELGRVDGTRTLTVPRDPRNFRHRTRLVDAGPSF